VRRVDWRVATAWALLAAALGSPSLARADDPPPIDLTIYKDGDTFLRPSVVLEAAIFSESNPFIGNSREVIGDHVGYWWEWAVTGGLDGALSLGGAGLLFGRTSLVGTGSQGLDAAGSDFNNRYPEKLEFEDAYLGWRSGALFPTLGPDALEVSVGKQRYQIDEGFFMWDGGSDGGSRGAYWIAPRKAFYMSAIAKLNTGPYKVEAFYLKPNDNPYTATNVIGSNFEYAAGETGKLGFTYMNIFSSQRLTRDGLNYFDWRLALTPLSFDRGFLFKGEYAYEMNPSESHSYAWYGEVGYAFKDVVANPFVSYRYADFGRAGVDSNGESTVWDPLFYGFYDWSTWYIGEIIGEFVTVNRGLVIQTVRLRAEPIPGVTTNLLYSYYRLGSPVSEIAARDLNPRAANITSKHIGQEFDLATDWTATSYLSFSGVIAAFDPGAGAKQYVQTNNSGWWLHFMLYTKVAF
jgi:Alginate export